MEFKILRIRKGITQTQLWEKTRISTRKIVAIEKGDYSMVTINNMKILSEVLEVPIQELFNIFSA